MIKSDKIKLSFQIGKVEILDSPKNFEHGKFIEGKVGVVIFASNFACLWLFLFMFVTFYSTLKRYQNLDVF